MNGMTSLEVCGLIRRQCSEMGGQKAWAEAHNISPQYLCDVLNARREPGESILAALGLRRLVRYVEVRSAKP